MDNLTEVDQERIAAYYNLPCEISPEDEEMMDEENAFCIQHPDKPSCNPAPLYRRDIEVIKEHLQEQQNKK